MSRMRLLYLTDHITWPLESGGTIRRWHILRGLAAAGDVDVVMFHPDGTSIDPRAVEGAARVIPLSSRYFSFTDTDRRRYASTPGRGWMTLGRRLPFEYQGPDRGALRHALAAIVNSAEYDLAWISDPRLAVPIRSLPVRTVLDGGDFAYVREWYLLRGSSWYGAKVWNYADLAKLWWYERGFARHYDIVTRCSRADAARHPAANVRIIANGAHVPPRIERAPEARALFVGDLGYQPTSQGLEWFLSQVWPIVRAAMPDAQLDVAGRRAPAFVEQAHGRDGVTVHGFVDDPAPLFARAALTITPLLAGGGTRLKILESLGRAVPAVSTTIGAFGVEWPADCGVRLVDDREEFATACVERLRDPSAFQADADRGRTFVAENYTWASISRAVTRLVETAGPAAHR
jgi:glycosyltransferase involved in cell wall biosynthesis